MGPDPDDEAAERAGMARMRAHVRGVFDQAATEAARAAGDVPRDGRTTAYADLRDDDRVRLVYAYAHDGWWLGELQATRRRGGSDGAWEGHCVWTEGIGSTYADWLPAERIQRGPSLGADEAPG